MFRITTHGQDNWRGTRPARSDADRQRAHGRLQPMPTERKPGLLSRLFFRP